MLRRETEREMLEKIELEIDRDRATERNSS